MSLFSRILVSISLSTGQDSENLYFERYILNVPVSGANEHVREHWTFMFAIPRTFKGSMVECSPIFNSLKVRILNIMFLNSFLKSVFACSNANDKRTFEHWTKMLALDQCFQYREGSEVYFGTPFIRMNLCSMGPYMYFVREVRISRVAFLVKQVDLNVM